MRMVSSQFGVERVETAAVALGERCDISLANGRQLIPPQQISGGVGLGDDPEAVALIAPAAITALRAAVAALSAHADTTVAVTYNGGRFPASICEGSPTVAHTVVWRNSVV